MLDPKVIAAFLKRRTDSWDWLKKTSASEVTSALAEMVPYPKGISKLWLHQQQCFLLLQQVKRFMLFIDMGGGKTLLTLSLLRYRKQCGERPKAIVFVPYITSVDTWIEEVAKHAPDLTCVPLTGSGADNFHALHDSSGDLYVICYQSAVAMVSRTVYNKKTKRNKWKATAEEIREYFADFDMLVMDEVHKCKSASSSYFRMCRAISAQCEWVLGLTGTPFGRDLQDLWPQMYLIDFGDTLGPNLGFYQAAFFDKKKGYHGYPTYAFKQKQLPVLQRMLKHNSIRYTIDEFADMEPMVPVRKTLPAPPDYQGYCQSALNNIKEAIKGKSTTRLRVVESNYMQLRQLSSGFMTLKGEDNLKVQFEFPDNPKLDVLQELIEAMPYGCKAVVFHHFVYTNQMISKRLKAMKVKHARVWGGQKDPLGELRRFRQDPNCTVLVLNDKSGSSSLNLQFANYMVFFEQPDSPIDRQQAERRVWRPGQAKRVFMYDMLMKGTADFKMHASNKAGENLLQKLLSGDTTWFRG